MAWYYNGQEITVGKSFKNTEGNLVGSGWLKFSPELKTDFGITWQDDPDLRFQNVDGTDRNLSDVKAEGIKAARGVAFRLLGDYDWYIVRNVELGTEIPSEVTTYRAAVRSAFETIKNAVNACDTLEAYKQAYSGDFESLNDWPNKPV
tara:strand:- start:1436 stop:1879 length:444 start_codon:yes stop_codon:yes gene_type:complete